MAGFEKQSSFCIQITHVFFAEQPSTDHALQWLSTSDYEKHSTYLKCTRAQNNYTQDNNNTIRNKESVQEWDKSLWSNKTCMAWQEGPPHAGWGFLEAEYQLCPSGAVHQLLGACILLNRDSYRNCKIGLPHCQMQISLELLDIQCWCLQNFSICHTIMSSKGFGSGPVGLLENYIYLKKEVISHSHVFREKLDLCRPSRKPETVFYL